jgi:DNA ligase-1
MQAHDIMQRLAATKSRTDKEQIIFDAYMNGCYEFFIGCHLCHNNLVSFGVKKVAEILEDDGAEGSYTFQDFLDLTNKLKTRTLTGHAARDAIFAAAENCHFDTWNQFYRRILLKDLNVGVDESTINKILRKLIPAYPEAEQYLIPVFKCQLAHDGEVAPHQKKIRGKKLVDTKLDGMRVLAVMEKEAGAVTMFTRNGLTIETFPEIKAVLVKILDQLPGSIVFDGELMSPRGFQHLMSLVKRKEPHPDTAIIRYALFDLIPLEDFHRAYSARTQRERRGVLEFMQDSGLFVDETIERQKVLYVVPQIEVDLDTQEGQDAFRNFNRWALDELFEGIMLKDPEAPYEGKRTASWLKSKPKISVSLEIVGVEPGEPDGKYAHTLGALVCEGDDLGVHIKTNVIGVSDSVRDQLWKDRDNLIGMVVEIVADKLTLKEGSTVYSLRFPTLKAFRGRVPGEKI